LLVKPLNISKVGTELVDLLHCSWETLGAKLDANKTFGTLYNLHNSGSTLATLATAVSNSSLHSPSTPSSPSRPQRPSPNSESELSRLLPTTSATTELFFNNGYAPRAPWCSRPATPLPPYAPSSGTTRLVRSSPLNQLGFGKPRN
jgi:hypothetical protein